MFKNIMLALERIERRQRLILEKLNGLEKRGEQERENRGPRKAGWLCGERTSGDVSEPCCMRQGEGYKARGDEWLESGIDNILAYQVGRKKGGEQA